MEITFYDCHGQAVAYMDDGEIIPSAAASSSRDALSRHGHKFAELK